MKDRLPEGLHSKFFHRLKKRLVPAVCTSGCLFACLLAFCLYACLRNCQLAWMSDCLSANPFTFFLADVVIAVILAAVNK